MKCWITFAAILLCGIEFPALGITPADLGPQHQVKVLTQRAYLPSIPVLVRVEVRNAQGGRELELWDADALLTANNGVTLSTNRVKLRNGLGSALVAFTGGGDFVLSAAVGTLQFSKALISVASTPVTSVGGTLAGPEVVWSGVIRVTNDVTVPSGVTLTILSNTLVLLDGVTSGTTANDFFISGAINSLGTEDQPVTITCNSANLAARWGQIRHDAARDSLYRYTSITRAGRAAGEGHTGTAPVFRPTNSKIRFESCNLTDYAEPTRGVTGYGTPGKVGQANGSDLTFIDCVLQRARMGPEIAGTALLCSNTWILDMRGPDDADGIYVHDQSGGQRVLFSHCVIAGGDDDGIDTLGSIVEVEDCIIRDWDNLFEDAKGISVFNGATSVKRTVIVNSTVGIAGKWSGGPATLITIDHCTFSQNLTNVWANFKPPGAPGPFIDFRITNSILWGGDPLQSDFGPTNFTVGFCDISEAWPGTGNIVADPLFVNSAAHDYHLRPYSPCIDSGNPASPLDPDGSPTDIGCFTFVPPAPVLASPRRLTDGTAGFVLNAYTNRNYVVESSDSLTNWTQLKTVFQLTPDTPVTDEAAATSNHRIYRTRLAP